MPSLTDVLLTRDPRQRPRLSQTLLAMAVLALAVAVTAYLAWAATRVPTVAVAAWLAINLVAMAGFYALIRTGWSQRFADPGLTAAQMVFALTSAALAYVLLGPARLAVVPLSMLVLMFGMFALAPRQMRWLCLYAVAVLGAAMAALALMRPLGHPVPMELGHFLLAATVLPAAGLLAARLSRLRHRAQRQGAELALALERLREQTTRDELTGLINKRQMQALMEQEHQRCIRSGQPFCLATFDIDRFKPVNEAHGYSVGDAVLRAVAEEARRQVRASDVLSRWGGDDFVLMLSDTRAALARGGIERLQQRVAALRILHGPTALGVTLSAGLAEHHAGEAVAETLARAERALQEARAGGRDKLVVAA